MLATNIYLPLPPFSLSPLLAPCVRQCVSRLLSPRRGFAPPPLDPISVSPSSLHSDNAHTGDRCVQGEDVRARRRTGLPGLYPILHHMRVPCVPTRRVEAGCERIRR